MRDEPSIAAAPSVTIPVADPDTASSDGAGASAEPPKNGSRAGRNLPAAIAVGAVLGFGVIAILVFVPYVWIGVVAVAMAVATHEVVRRLRAAGYAIPVVPLLVGGQAMVWLSWPFERVGLLAAFVVTILACLVWRFREGVDGYVRDMTASVFVASYVPLFASFAAMLVVPDDGAYRALCFLIGVVCSDTGGYAAGVLFGKHPMAPSISPKKSWEGFAGSMVTGAVGSALSVTLLLHGQWWQGVLLGAALVITSTVGDLVESLIKRDLGIKDMGNLLPGHGGLMDRMDSLLPSAVVAWLLLRMFVPA